MTSYGIMKIADWELGNKRGQGAMYRMPCSCGSPDCDMTLCFDLEDGICMLHLYKNLEWADHWKKKWWHQRMWLRIKAATKLLFTGWIELEDEMVLDQKQIPDVILALQESQEMIKQYNEEWEKEHEKTH